VNPRCIASHFEKVRQRGDFGKTEQRILEEQGLDLEASCDTSMHAGSNGGSLSSAAGINGRDVVV